LRIVIVLAVHAEDRVVILSFVLPKGVAPTRRATASYACFAAPGGPVFEATRAGVVGRIVEAAERPPPIRACATGAV